LLRAERTLDWLDGGLDRVFERPAGCVATFPERPPLVDNVAGPNP
jgi:hypothetical protein